jgi:hypothetical protein
LVLLVAYASRAIWFWPSFIASLRDPTTAMAYFTIVAGSNVLATRLLMTGNQEFAIILCSFGTLVWLFLTYGLPFFIVASARRPILREINGTWLIWVVATQSVAMVASGIAATTANSVIANLLSRLCIVLWSWGDALSDSHLYDLVPASSCGGDTFGDGSRLLESNGSNRYQRSRYGWNSPTQRPCRPSCFKRHPVLPRRIFRCVVGIWYLVDPAAHSL